MLDYKPQANYSTTSRNDIHFCDIATATSNIKLNKKEKYEKYSPKI